MSPADRRRAAGLCPGCGEARDITCARCCLAASERRRRKRAAGLCVDCGVTSETGTRRCYVCSMANEERAAARRAA